MIPYDWNKFVSHVKSLIIIISQMGVFGGYDHKYVVNSHFDKLSLWKMTTYVKWVIFKNFILDIFWLTNSNSNLVQSKNKNKLYYIVYTINVINIP